MTIAPASAATISVNDVHTYADALAFYGDGIVCIDTPEVIAKEDLLDVPFFIVTWRWNCDRETGRVFVSVEAITADDRKVVINDGSTGIMAQLRAIEDETGRPGGVMVPHGLRVSRYGVDANGAPLPAGSTEKPDSIAQTFYLQ